MTNKNWLKLSTEDENRVWSNIEKFLEFRPYDSPKILDKTQAGVWVDVSTLVLGGESPGHANQALEAQLRRILNRISMNEPIFFLDWRHECFLINSNKEFNGLLEPNMITLMPNGDYYFYISASLSDGIFADGIENQLYVWGEHALDEIV